MDKRFIFLLVGVKSYDGLLIFCGYGIYLVLMMLCEIDFMFT